MSKTRVGFIQESKLLKSNPDVSLFIDSVKKLSKDINRNYSIESSDQPKKKRIEEVRAVLCLVGVDAKPFVINQNFVKIGRSDSCQVFQYSKYFFDYICFFFLRLIWAKIATKYLKFTQLSTRME